MPRLLGAASRPLVMAMVGAMAFTAWAAEWSGTKSYTANTTISEAITVSGEVVVEVAEGKTVTLKGAITGADKITKTGLGTLLILSANDNFSGGFVIEKGYLTASNATALGSAAVTIVGQTAENSGTCGLGLWGTGKGNTTGITYANAVNITGNTTYAYPALVVYGQGAKLTGKITAAKDFVFYDDYNSTAAIWSGKSDRATDGNVISLTFGEVEVGGTLFNDGWCKFIFDGKVTAPTVSFGSFRPSTYSGAQGNRWAIFEFNAASEIGTLTNAYHSLILNAANVFNGTKYVINGSVTQRALLTLNGNAQRFNCFDTAPYTASENSVRGPTSSSLTTVTIDGGGEMPAGMQENRVACFERFMKSINLTVDAYDGFTQVISNRSHTMSGTLTVNNGALEIGGDAGFTALPTIVVGAVGKLTVDTTYGKAFKALTSITVNGTLELTANVDTPIPDTAALTIGESGWVDLSGGVLAVKSLTVNGVAKSGTLTHSDLPDNLAEGSTIIVKGTDTIEYTDVDKTASGDWHVYVFAGCTNMVRVALTGNGRLIKEGPGILMLTKESSYKGGTTISAGYVRVETNNVFGTGEITILGQHGNYSGPCEIDMIGCPKVNKSITYHTTITNDIHITGNTAIAYPAIVGFNNGSIVSGKITADGDFFFKEDELSAKAISTKGYYDICNCVTSLTFGEVNATGSITHDGWATFVFNGKVVAGAFFAGGYLNGSNWNAAYKFNDDVELNAITNRCHTMTFAKSLTIANKYYAAKRSQIKGGHLNVNGAQSIGGISDDVNLNASTWYYTAQKASTLTITGLGSAATECNTTYKFDGPLSITLDATDNFTQCLSNRVNEMTGAITVKKGTLKIVGAATFASVSALNVQGGTLEINSTTANCFSSVTAVSVTNGALLKLTSTTAMPFADRSVDLELGETGKVYIPEGVTWNINRLIINGRRKSAGGYTAAELANNITGGGTLDAGGAQAENIWTGQGGDHNIDTQGNWESEVSSFTDGTLGTTFATGGEEAVVNTPVKFASLLFNTPNGSNGFAFSRSGEGRIELASTIEFADDQDANQNAHVYTLGAPMTLAEEQALNVPTNDTLKITGGLTTTAGISLDGKGTLEIGGTNTIDGRLELSNFERLTLSGKITASDPESQGSPSTKTTGHSLYISRKGFYQEKGTVSDIPVVLDNVYVDKPTYLEPIQNYYRRLIYCKPATTNIFARAVTTQQAQFEVTVAEGAELNLAGGVTSGWSFYKFGSGLMRISGGSWTQTKSLLCSYEGPIRLESTGNKFNRLVVNGTTSRLEIAVDNAIASAATCEITKGTMDILVGTQRVPFVLATTAATLTGSEGAVLFSTNGGVPVGATKYGTTNLCCKITGAVGVTQGGAQKLVINTKAESTGPLAVTNGVLELTANASWLNGTDFTARGKGTLKLASASQINEEIAALHLAESGKVELPSGVTLKVASAETNGVALAIGTYSSEQLGGFITDGCTLKVGKKGTTILLW